MNKFAIFHISDVPYAYGKDDETLVVRIRFARNDIKKCKIHYKDRYDWDKMKSFSEKEMELKEYTDLFEYYETEISIDEKRFRYYFEIYDMEGKTYYYNERGIQSGSVEETRSFQFPYLCKADVYKSVNWAQEGIVYQIFPDRFNNGDESINPEDVSPWGDDVTRETMFGGDLQGIIDKVPYLKDLGVTIIYLTPIFLSSTNHKYNTCDYYKVDPCFGDIEKAKELVDKCHEAGIRVTLDAVFNHSGSDFFAFKDVIEKGEKSKYKDWFFIESYPVDAEKVNYLTFAESISNMPKLNTQNPEVVDYLLGVAKYWIKEIGIDGWRLDVCDEVDHAFWREFRKAVKDANPDALIIGEISHESSSFLRGEQLDSIMNYPFRDLCLDFFAKGVIDSQEFIYGLADQRARYMDGINKTMFNLLGSHDVARFLTECDGNVEKLKLAVAFKFTYIGIPYVYYGDEVGVEGENDPYCRRCMIWDEDKQDRDLYEFHKKLSAIRRENKSLIYGEFMPLYFDDGVVAYKRICNDEECICILNNFNGKRNIEIDIYGSYSDIMESEEVKINNGITLNPYEIKILRKYKY